MPTSTKQANREFRHQGVGVGDQQDTETPKRSARAARPSGRGKATTGTVERPQQPQHSRRDPAQRTTGKPKVNLRHTSQTAPLRTAMDSISECFGHCLEQGGEHVTKEHLTCMLDAWDLLNATSALVARGSEHADGLRTVCAEAVKACEESCEEFGDDQTMVACADVCREAYEHLVA